MNDKLHETVASALAEDIGSGDVTADLVSESATIAATVVTREPMILAGRRWFDEVMRQVDGEISTYWHFSDGDAVGTDATICELHGPARSILTAERTALNFLQLLSATATETARHVAAVEGTGCRILDTRKTIPGLRQAQKYAVRCGGGVNHRIGLFDAILIKENHVASAGSITAAVAAARSKHPELPVEVEVETLEQLGEALSAAVERVLLDNFSLDQLRKAVQLNGNAGEPAAELEASGGIRLDTLRETAETGVDFVSVGALTKDLRAIDLSMRFAASA